MLSLLLLQQDAEESSSRVVPGQETTEGVCLHDINCFFFFFFFFFFVFGNLLMVLILLALCESCKPRLVSLCSLDLGCRSLNAC